MWFYDFGFSNFVLYQYFYLQNINHLARSLTLICFYLFLKASTISTLSKKVLNLKDKILPKTKFDKTSKVRQNRKGAGEHPLPRADIRCQVFLSVHGLSMATLQVCRLCTIHSSNPREYFLSFHSETYIVVLFPAFLIYWSFCSLLILFPFSLPPSPFLSCISIYVFIWPFLRKTQYFQSAA